MRTISEAIDRNPRIDRTLAWTSPIKKRQKLNKTDIIVKYVKLYCEHCSLVGYKYLIEPNRNWVERITWIFVHIGTLCAMGLIVYGVYAEYERTPILTMLDTDLYPTDYLEYPGVAICSVNRISRRSAIEMATEVFRANVTNLSFDGVLDLLTQLGYLYESLTALDQNARKHEELNYVLRKYYDGDYDITEILKNLTPQCSSTILKCRFNGHSRNCSELFTFRKTQDGFCCTFNYIREDDDIPILPDKFEHVQSINVEDLGLERGLTVVLDPCLDDYFYKFLPMNGWKVTVFNPTDYPDQTSGGVSELLVPPLTETSVEIDAVSFYSTRIVASYPIEKRKCIFDDEGQYLYANYSYSDCIVDCKLEEIWEICKCRPFHYPRRGKTEYSRRVCNAMDILCLEKYNLKWLSILPSEVHDNPLVKRNLVNLSLALHCYKCYPSCEDVHYNVRVWNAYMEPGLYKTQLLNNMTITNHSVLHMFFTNYGTKRLRQDVVYQWYELMSNIGGICGVFIGFSLISVVEIVYYSALLLLELWKGPIRADDDAIDAEYRDDRSTLRTIYWSELLPHAAEPKSHYHNRKRRFY